MKKVLVTGANGFIGKNLYSILKERFDCVIGSIRTPSCDNNLPYDLLFSVGSISSETDWSNALVGVDVVVHLAARAHVTKEYLSDPLEEYMEVNCYGTLNLAEHALKNQVKRFVYISSIGVLGNKTEVEPFTDLSTPNPTEPYAVSKYNAELELERIGKSTSMEIVIIRPPLVYGINAPGNFRRLINLVSSNFPLPFSGINNIRSMISIKNLIDFISLSSVHPKAANQTFIISDGSDTSTRDLVIEISKALNKKLILFNIPVFLLKALGVLLHQERAIGSLCNSLVIKSSKAQDLLGWNPQQDLNNGVREAVECHE